MDTFLLRIFQGEVALQCRFVLLAAEQLNEAQRFDVFEAFDVSDPSVRPAARQAAERNRVAIWSALQTILVSAANISKLLWGSGGRRDEERKELRATLEVDEASHLRSPKLRNDFEHFDERLRDWFASGETFYAGRNISSIPISNEPTSEFGTYDPETGVVVFWENSANVREIVAEVARLLPIAAREADRL